MTSKSSAFSYTSESIGSCSKVPRSCLPARGSACGQAGCNLALVCASPAAKKRHVMTAAYTSSSVMYEAARSVPPY